MNNKLLHNFSGNAGDAATAANGVFSITAPSDGVLQIGSCYAVVESAAIGGAPIIDIAIERNDATGALVERAVVGQCAIPDTSGIGSAEHFIASNGVSIDGNTKDLERNPFIKFYKGDVIAFDVSAAGSAGEFRPNLVWELSTESKR